MAKATGSNTVAKTDNNPPTIKDRKMLAQGPACALARFSFVKSTRAKAQNNIKRSGPFLCRDLAHFYSAIDIRRSKGFTHWLQNAILVSIAHILQLKHYPLPPTFSTLRRRRCRIKGWGVGYG